MVPEAVLVIGYDSVTKLQTVVFKSAGQPTLRDACVCVRVR